MNLTKMEKDIIKVMNTVSAGDTQFPSTEDYAWFGLIDYEFQDEAAKFGIEGRSISGLVSSLVKKGVVAVDDLDGEMYYYIRDEDLKKL